MDAYNPHKVVVKGFPRDMSSLVLEKHAKASLQALVSGKIASQAIVHCTRAKKFYSIEFADSLHVKDFLTAVKAHGLRWEDARNGSSCILRAQVDQSVTQQLTNRVLYKMYPIMEKFLKDIERYDPMTMKLGSTSTPRKFMLETEDNELYVFFTVAITDSKTAQIEPNYEDLAEFGIAKEVADAILDEATKAAEAALSR